MAHVIIVSAQSKELGFWFFQTWSDLRVRIWGLLGHGIGDLDSGLTIKKENKLAFDLTLCYSIFSCEDAAQQVLMSVCLSEYQSQYGQFQNVLDCSRIF